MHLYTYSIHLTHPIRFTPAQVSCSFLLFLFLLFSDSPRVSTFPLLLLLLLINSTLLFSISVMVMNWSILSLEVNTGKTPCPHAATYLMIHSCLIKWDHITNKQATLIHYFCLWNESHSEQISQLSPTFLSRKRDPHSEEARKTVPSCAW